MNTYWRSKYDVCNLVITIYIKLHHRQDVHYHIIPTDLSKLLVQQIYPDMNNGYFFIF